MSSKDYTSGDHFPKTSKYSNHTPRSSPSQESTKSSASISSKALQETASTTKAQRSGFPHIALKDQLPLYITRLIARCILIGESRLLFVITLGSKILHGENFQVGQGRYRNSLEEDL